MVNQIYQQAVSQIEANRAREIEIAKQKVMQEQIIPFNRDIDNSLQNAYTEIQAEQAEKIAKIQEDYELKKAELAKRAQDKKAQFADSAINAAIYTINTNAEKALAPLKKFLSEQGA